MGGQPESQSMKAPLWGVGLDGKGGGRYNGWEAIVYPTYILATLILTVGVGFAPDTSIKTWANQEARVRINMKRQGALKNAAFVSTRPTALPQFRYSAIPLLHPSVRSSVRPCNRVPIRSS